MEKLPLQLDGTVNILKYFYLIFKSTFITFHTNLP